MGFYEKLMACGLENEGVDEFKFSQPSEWTHIFKKEFGRKKTDISKTPALKLNSGKF